MKGTILTGFLDWVRESHGVDFVDDLLDGSKLESGGAYTSVGAYPCAELVEIANVMAKMTDQDPQDLLFRFARESFSHLTSGHQFLLEGIKDGVELIEVTESHIHVEVLAMYPDTTLPTVKTSRRADGSLEVTYSSVDPLARMAEGRLWGALDLYGQDADISVLEMAPDRRRARFLVTVKGA